MNEWPFVRSISQPRCCCRNYDWLRLRMSQMCVDIIHWLAAARATDLYVGKCISFRLRACGSLSPLALSERADGRAQRDSGIIPPCLMGLPTVGQML